MLKEKIKYQLVRTKNSVEGVRESGEFILKKYNNVKSTISKENEQDKDRLLRLAIQEDLDDSVIIYSMLSRFDICITELVSYLENEQYKEDKEILSRCINVFEDIINHFKVEDINCFDELKNILDYMAVSIRYLVGDILSYNYKSGSGKSKLTNKIQK